MLDKIIEYVKNEVENGNYPSYNELHKEFGIRDLKIKLSDIYSKLGVRLLDLKCKRPNSSLSQLKEELIDYIKKETKLGHFPTRREIELGFRLSLTPIFREGIKQLYKEANVEYSQKINQEIKDNKASLLNNVVISILPKLGLELLKNRGTHDRGIDIITKNFKGERIGLELKAYNKLEQVKSKHIKQVLRFIKEENLDMVFIITTTQKIEYNLKFPESIKLIDYERLINLCNKDSLREIDYIREKSVNVESFYKIKKRKTIIDYVKEKAKKGEDINCKDIAKDHNIHFYTYFNNLKEVYRSAGLNIPLRKIKGARAISPDKEEIDKVINKILDYMREQLKNKVYITAEDIKREFGISHIWNIISMAELYRMLGEKPYLERKRRKVTSL